MSHPAIGNIFAGIPVTLPEELTEALLHDESLRIERIVSRCHASPPGFWYDQPNDEWVILLRGSAVMAYEGGERVELRSGDYLNIPAHVRHRVESTDPREETVWLAIHYTARPGEKETR